MTEDKKSQKKTRRNKKSTEKHSQNLHLETESTIPPIEMESIKEDSNVERKESDDENKLGSESNVKNTGGSLPEMEGSNPKEKEFAPLVLEKTVIAMPLFTKFEEKKKAIKKTIKKTGEPQNEPVYPIIIDINLMYSGGREAAKKRVKELISEILKNPAITKKAIESQGFNQLKTKYSQQYVFAVLEEQLIKKLVELDMAGSAKGAEPFPGAQAIYHIWPDFEIQKMTTKSVVTVKADAARNAFSALGNGIYWAVMDSGIDGTHPHFEARKNLKLPDLPDPLQHRDFTVLSNELSENVDSSNHIDLSIDPNEKPLEDEFGHGTHVAGIIAGELKTEQVQSMGDGKQEKIDQTIIATTLFRDENKKIVHKEMKISPGISGMAPDCKLVSLKVLNKSGQGHASNLIAAIQWIQEINGYGRRIRIHGVNMSVGYEFEPQWFACGQSPLCVEVDRLVKSGVVVVVAAGNTGYGFVQAQGKKTSVTAGLDLTINDPGNADFAITVGSTHREMPHIYGVSYFSSKGPTGDGRLKPDLVAPGEKIISCDSSQRRALDTHVKNSSEIQTDLSGPGETSLNVKPETELISKPTGFYREDSGTSMAAPHVSGVIAAFLSVRREFIGQPEVVKEIFLSTATDLKRERYFQGHGLVDLMRAIQSV